MEIIIRINASSEYPKALEHMANLVNETTTVDIVLAIEEEQQQIKPYKQIDSFFDSIERDAQYERERLHNPLR